MLVSETENKKCCKYYSEHQSIFIHFQYFQNYTLVCFLEENGVSDLFHNQLSIKTVTRLSASVRAPLYHINWKEKWADENGDLLFP